MRILMLNYEYPPLGGGAANATQYLLKEFAKEKKLHIDLITASPNQAFTKKIAPNITHYGLNIGKRGRNLHYQSNLDLLKYGFKSYRLGQKLIAKKQFHLIHAWMTYPAGFVAMKLGLTYLVALRGSDVPFYNPRFKLLDTFIFQHLSRRVWQQAAAITANSQGLKDLALKTKPDADIKVIHNGVDTNFFKPGKKQALVILFVGRLIKRKGAHQLIKAFSKQNPKIKRDWRLWLVGEGPELATLKKHVSDLKIKGKVKFWGKLDKPSLKKVYQTASIFALPSLSEGMSNAVLEAMASGLSVVVTPVGGSDELVTENGIILEDFGTETLTKSLHQLITDPEKRNQMSLSSRSKANQKSWPSTANEYLEIYSSKLNNK